MLPRFKSSPYKPSFDEKASSPSDLSIIKDFRLRTACRAEVIDHECVGSLYLVKYDF